MPSWMPAINFIDTGERLRPQRGVSANIWASVRGEFYLATKCGCTVVRRDDTTDDTPHVWTRENLFRGLHESLERMKTDYVDIMQLHRSKCGTG